MADAADRAQDEYRPVESGLCNTDQCPVCGRAMTVDKETRLDLDVTVLRCESPYHRAEVVIRETG